jgi:ParB/RepB/Spo0J family partition protein
MGKTSFSETTAGARKPSSKREPRSATRSPESTTDSGTLQLIDLSLINPPTAAVRSTFDEVQLGELAQSIIDMGLLQPIIVKSTGARFEVIAGHRRLIACQLAKLDPVPCLVREPGAVDDAAVKLAENYYREPVNPAEEAAFLEELLHTRCNGDTDVLAALIKHPRAYVEDRILIGRGDPQILDALRNRQISLTVARELNKVKDPDLRLVYTSAAVRGGATASVVRSWRNQEVQNGLVTSSEEATNAAAQTAAAIAAATELRCFFCSEADEPERIEHLWLHKHCRKYVEKILQLGAPAAAAAEGAQREP